MFTRVRKKANKLISNILIGFIKLYQYCLSPFLPKTCRFIPTCSEYANDAISQFGVWRGLLISLRRVSRCHPFNHGGYDPLPPKIGK